MALPKLPSLQEVFNNPSVLLGLPAPLIEEFVRQLAVVEQSAGEQSGGYPDPVSLALATNPRYRWMDTRHIHYLGEGVAVVVRERSAVIILMPPRHAKTTTCSVWTPFWFLVDNPEEWVLLISYEANFARKWGVKVRNLVELYGQQYGLHLNPKRLAGDDWELMSGGGMRTVGRGGGISGNPAKLLIGDDLLKNKEEADSEIIRETTWDWIESIVFQRIEPDTATIFIGTRYHEDDYLGRLIKGSESGAGMHFDQIVLRAKAEADDPLGREIGEGLWTDHPLPSGGTWGQEFYDKREAELSAYSWHSIYQQRPSPPGGNMVDPAWWRFYRPSELPTSFDQEIQSWDLALDSQKKTDSFHCGGVLSRKGALVFLRDAYHEHSKIATSPDKGERTVIGAIRAWTEIYRAAQQKLVERAIAGPMLIQTLYHEIPGLIPWPPKGTRKGSKEACLNACVPTIRSGNVLLPLNPDGTKPKWVDEFIEELRQFPRAPHDDYVDMFSQGLSFLLPSVRAAIDSDHTAAKNRRPATTSAAAHTAAIHQLLKKLAEPRMKAMRRFQNRQDRSVLPFARVPKRLLEQGARRGPRRMW